MGDALALRRSQIGSGGCPMELITASIHRAEITCDLYSSTHLSDNTFYCHCAVIPWRKPATSVRCSADKDRGVEIRAGQGRGDQNGFFNE